MNIKRAMAVLVFAVVCATPTHAQFTASRAFGDPAYWLFMISHTDPNTRLTQIDFTDLPPLYVMGLGYGYITYNFSYYFPTPVPGATEQQDGRYLAPSYGWRVINPTLTSFSLVHDAGFQGAAGLYTFQSAAFHHDIEIWEGPPYAEGSHSRWLSPSDLMSAASYTYVTPEPATLLLLGSGLIGLGAMRRRKRHNSGAAD